MAQVRLEYRNPSRHTAASLNNLLNSINLDGPSTEAAFTYFKKIHSKFHDSSTSVVQMRHKFDVSTVCIL